MIKVEEENENFTIMKPKPKNIEPVTNRGATIPDSTSPNIFDIFMEQKEGIDDFHSSHGRAWINYDDSHFNC